MNGYLQRFLSVAIARDLFWQSCLVIIIGLYFLFPSFRDALIFGDGRDQHLVFWEYSASELRSGRLPFWNPYIYSGFPYISSSLTSFFYPTTLLFLIDTGRIAQHIAMCLPALITAVFQFAFLRDLRISRLSAFVMALAAALCAALLTHQNHVGMAAIAGWIAGLFFSVHRLVRTGQSRYIWLTAVIIALQFAAGHPQVFIYSLVIITAFSVFLTIFTRRSNDWLPTGIRIAFALGLGVGLAGLPLLSSLELSSYTGRGSSGFAYFSSGSIPPAFLATLVTPWLYGPYEFLTLNTYWGPLSEWWEGLQYIGVLGVPLVVIAVVYKHKNPHVRALALTLMLLMILALGRYTPLHNVLFNVPVYGLFRLSARYMSISGPLFAALAAIGLDFVLSSKWSFWRTATHFLISSAMILVILSFVMLIASRDEFSVFLNDVKHYRLRSIVLSVTLTFILMSGLTVALFLYKRTATDKWRYGLAIVLVVLWLIDLSGVYFPFWVNIQPPRITKQQIDACAGSDGSPQVLEAASRIAVVEVARAGFAHACPANSALLTRRPSINGYDSLVLARIADFLSPDGYGTYMHLSSALGRAPLLDAWGVRDVIAQAPLDPGQPPGWGDYHVQDLGFWLDPGRSLMLRTVPAGQSEGPAGGLESSSGISVGVAEPLGAAHVPMVAQSGGRARRFPSATRVRVASRLIGAAGVEQGTPVAEVTITDFDGTVVRRPLRAGIDTADEGWVEASERGQARHAQPPGAVPIPTGQVTRRVYTYIANVLFDRRAGVESVEIKATGPHALFVEQVTLFDDTRGTLVPLRKGALILGHNVFPKYRLVDSLIVFENDRALPRAWLVGETLTVPAEASKRAMLDGTLPDGRRFDPRTLVLTERGPSERLSPPGDPGTAEVRDQAPGRYNLAVKAHGEAMLVVGEAWYPGWTATIDGVPARVERVNHAQMGVRVGPGEHQVRVWYEPTIFKVGALITGLSLLLGAFFTFPPLTRRWVRLGRTVLARRAVLVGPAAHPAATQPATGRASALRAAQSAVLTSTWPARLLVLAIAVYVVVFAARSIATYTSVNTLFDLATFVQGFWNALHGTLFNYSLESPRPGGEISRFGRHFSPIFFLFVPLYALLPSPITLLVVQALALGLGAVPLYWIARPRFGAWAALLLAVAYLLSPMLHDVNLVNEFHEIAFSVPLLLLAWQAAVTGRWRWYALWLGLTLAVKEDLALTAIAFGLYLALARRRWVAGGLTVAAGIGWLAVVVYLIMPAPRGGESVPFPGYEYLGADPAAMIRGALQRPGAVWEVVTEPAKQRYLFWILAPLAGLPLIGIEVFLVATPALLIILGSTYVHTYDLFERYVAPVIPFAFIATAIGIERVLHPRGRIAARWPPARRLSRTWLAALLAGLVVGLTVWSIVRLDKYPRGIQFAPTPHDAAALSLIERIPAAASVTSADHRWLAHLAHRRFLYFLSADSPPTDYVLLDSRVPPITNVPAAVLDRRQQEVAADPAYRLAAEADGIRVYARRDLPADRAWPKLVAGELVKGDDPAVYLFDGTVRRPIPSVEVLQCFGPRAVQVLDRAALDALPPGPGVPSREVCR